MANNKILTEELYDYYDDFKYQTVTEEVAGKKKYFIRGPFSKGGVVNKNKRVYPVSVLKEQVDSCQEAIKANRMVGELEHPSSPKINLERVALKVNELRMADDGTMLGEMEVLDTPLGKTLQTLIDSGVGLGVSTRGTGTTKKVKYRNENGMFEDVVEVQPDFKLRAIDVVFDPSAGEAGTPQFVAEGLEIQPQDGKTTTFGAVWKQLFP